MLSFEKLLEDYDYYVGSAGNLSKQID